MQRKPTYYLISFFFFFFLFLPVPSIASALFENDPVLQSDTGYVALRWSASDNHDIELQQADNPDFKNAQIIYVGKNSALFLSGLKDGVYYYRLRAGQESWSPSVTLNVHHHAIEKAWFLFGLGAFIFLSIVFVIWRGNKEHE